jgi:hypothetical protein
MTDLPEDIQARRSIEDRFINLGTERRELQDKTKVIVKAMVDLVPEALQAGISFDGIAKLIGIPRQTLYRWQEIAEFRRRKA